VEEELGNIKSVLKDCFSYGANSYNLADILYDSLLRGGPDEEFTLIDAILKVASSLERIAVAAEVLSGIEVQDAE
jgi:hypothetical protein